MRSEKATIYILPSSILIVRYTTDVIPFNRWRNQGLKIQGSYQRYSLIVNKAMSKYLKTDSNTFYKGQGDEAKYVCGYKNKYL